MLRSNPAEFDAYITDFEEAVQDAAAQCRKDSGELKMTLGFVEDKRGKWVELNWNDITRLTTAIGSLTLTIRGSDKSTYGKLFERLVLGSVLTILGFRQVDRATNTQTERVFWLSDSSDTRECDATLILRPGKIARFDIGFIGPGNSEISKDKLTRYAREIELSGRAYTSQTFIIVDRLPDTSKTREAAIKIGAEIVQMSMQYWPRDLAQRLERRLNYHHELSTMSDEQVSEYLRTKIASVSIEDFLTNASSDEMEGDGSTDSE